MDRDRRHRHRSHIHGARVTWDTLAFWDRFRCGRIISDGQQHEVLSINTHGVEFMTPHPPERGSHLLLNVFLPGEACPFAVRGVVDWVRSRSEHRGFRVSARFDGRPDALATKIRELKGSSAVP